MKKIFLFPIIALCLQFTSCAPVAPVIDSQGNVAVSRPSNRLIQQGQKEFHLLKKKKRLSSNTSYNAQTQRVAARLKRVIQMPGASWEFVVFDDPTPNAFALPGGKVGIHSGLFPITRTDAGLAAVLGHEIAHITRNHAGKRQKRSIGLVALGLIIDQVAKRSGASGINRAKLGLGYGTLAAVGHALPFSRNVELEADKIGTIYMAKAGYNPHEAVEMWERFAAYNQRKGGNNRPEFLRTHPIDAKRINALKAFLPTAMREYNRR